MTAVLVAYLTLVCFAANSLLCRMALGGHRIDPISFTSIRLVSGALALLLLSRLLVPGPVPPAGGGSWRSGFALLAYAVTFSLAYVTLNAGMGALLLFGSVQVTMFAAALTAGERPGPAQWLGSGAAVAGLVYLVLPGISAPDPVGALLMAVAGVAWGFYSIRGRGVTTPVAMTAGNFARSVPLALVAAALVCTTLRAEPMGVVLALVSGVVTSGLGYILWYRTLRHLTTAQAAVVQLIVPVLAAFGGVTFLGERVSIRLIAGSVLILGGVALAVMKRSPAVRAS